MRLREKINLVPSIADVIFITVFVRLSFSGSALLYDGDTGFHIRAGEYIIENLMVPTRDIFTYLAPSPAWSDHEWLSQVVMALVHGPFGLPGIVVLFSFLIALVYFLLFKALRSYGGDIITTTLMVILVMVASQLHWLARPHIFTLLFFIAWYYLLDIYQYRGRNRLYILPALMVLWVNFHAAFILGLGLLGVYLAGNVLTWLFGIGEARVESGRRAKALGLVLVACTAAALLNPEGYHALLFPFEVSANRVLVDNIMEFLSPNFHASLFVPFKYMILLTVAVFAFSRSRPGLIELVLLVLFMSMSLYSARHIPLFAIIAAPVLVRRLDGLLDEYETGRAARLVEFIRRRSGRLSGVDASARGFAWPVLALVGVVFLFTAGGIEGEFDEKLKPVAAVEFIKREDIGGRMFNKDEFGDYIIYSSWPEVKVFIDGRVDIHGPEGIKEYLRVARVEPGWDEVLEEKGIDWVIFQSGSTLTQILFESDDWRLIYSDGVADIFVRDNEEMRAIAEKYADTPLVLPKGDEGEDEDEGE